MWVTHMQMLRDPLFSLFKREGNHVIADLRLQPGMTRSHDCHILPTVMDLTHRRDLPVCR